VKELLELQRDKGSKEQLNVSALLKSSLRTMIGKGTCCTVPLARGLAYDLVPSFSCPQFFLV
jgi:hypothetical protein